MPANCSPSHNVTLQVRVAMEPPQNHSQQSTPSSLLNWALPNEGIPRLVLPRKACSAGPASESILLAPPNEGIIRLVSAREIPAKVTMYLLTGTSDWLSVTTLSVQDARPSCLSTQLQLQLLTVKVTQQLAQLVKRAKLDPA
jgi:hypothetical protein